MRRERDDWRRLLFANAVRGEDGEINLALASLLFALDRHPELDLSIEMRTLDTLAEDAARVVPAGDGAEAALGALARYLREGEGFDGSPEAYASTAGCFLSHALEHRTGLPITLSVVYLEVGWRLGLPLEGVGLPGHFVIKYDRGLGDPERDVYCDPFHGGRLLSAEGCRELLQAGLGAGFEFRPEFLLPVTRRAILYRMLNNLKSTYLREGDAKLALWATDRMVLVHPGSARDMRDRGLLRYAVEDFGRATSDLVSYLTMQPDAPDAELIRRQLAASVERSGLLN